jgi:hypothetical protein
MRRVAHVGLVTLWAATAAACVPRGAAPLVAGAPRAASVEWFVGTMTTTSPDGATPYGPPARVAARRAVDPARGAIEEQVVHPGEALPTTTLRRVAGSNRFEATDAAGSFTGTLELRGPEWAWDAWSYDLSMADGSGRLRGEGKLTAAGLETEKIFHAPDGRAVVRIVERLERVDAAAFAQARDELLAMPKPR